MGDSMTTWPQFFPSLTTTQTFLTLNVDKNWHFWTTFDLFLSKQSLNVPLVRGLSFRNDLLQNPYFNKPKIVKSPREKTPKRKTSPSLRKLSSESQNLPSKSFDDSTTSIESTKFVSKKKPAKNNNVAAQPGQVQKRLNLDRNCKKLGKNKSHSARYHSYIT